MNPKLKLLPLLLLYLLIITLQSTPSLESDEGRYLSFAENLTQGFYSPPGVVKLESGPGYPLVLCPFVSLKLSLHFLRFTNAFLLFLAVLYFYLLLRLYVLEKPAFALAYVFGLYPLFLKSLHFLLTETFTIFLITGFLYHFCKAFVSDRSQKLQMLLSIFYLGYLALTKVFFGYLLLAVLVVFSALALWRRTLPLKKTALIYAGALIFCVPYLVYTHSLTGKIFYWTTYGGSNLYWMSTPFEGELGDWKGNGLSHLHELRDSGIPQPLQNHGQFFGEIRALSPVEWNERLKAKAIENIARHPVKFFKNWICNVGRLLFNYPYSFTPQRMGTLFNIWASMFLIVPSVFSLYATCLNWKKIPFEILALLFFGIAAFGGSSLLAAYERQFRVLVPIFFLWNVVTLTRAVRIEVRR